MSLAQSLLLDFEDEKEGVDSNNDVDHSATSAAGESHRQLQFLDPQKQSPVVDSDQESKVRRTIQDNGDPELENELDRILNDPQIDKFTGKKLNDVNEPALLDKNLEQYNDFSEANSFIKKINLASERLHKKLVHIYSKRFLHLASLIPNPELYVLAVKELKNEPSSVKFNENLPKILSNSVIMNMSLSQFTSPGEDLSEEELKICESLIEKFENLNEKKMVLLEFIEIHLTKLAPNLTKLLGTSIAAQLLTSVGGLNNLVTIPSCDVHLIGSERIVTATGALSYSKQNGIVYSTDIVINTSPEFVKKAVKLVCNKISIAARCDLYNSGSDGQTGEKLRSQITDHLEKIQEPLWLSKNGAHDDKALPVPQEPPRRRRGGRRARKAKEILGMSEIRKQSNLMAFGKISEDITQMEVGKDYGKLGTSGSNRVRKSKIDVKTMSKISKKMQGHVKKENTNAAQTFSRVGGNATVLKHQLQKASGSASSVISFTPLQGLEIIVNSNNAADNDKEGIDREDGYFSSLAQFNKRDAKDFTI